MPRPDRLIAILVLVVLFAWGATIVNMGGMDDGPGTALGPLAVFLVSWVLMMIAMMLPAELRFTLAYVRAARAAQPGPLGPRVGAFLAGYLATWVAYGVIAWLLDRALRSLAPAALAWDAQGPLLAGAVVVAAGLFQFTPWKQACLTHCVSPFGFFMQHWHDDLGGALRLGATHGIYCVGCCWALMAVMFAVGVMSLLWMTVLALAMLFEKLAPVGWRVAPVLGMALIVLGAWLAFEPSSVPGLTLPGSAVHLHLH
ncbi:MAG: DUF2182 domain-containing protein [Gammaproteobacteria bacterium]